jgi:hypothetical protein
METIIRTAPGGPPAVTGADLLESDEGNKATKA